jgi:hypothetical protein
MDLPSTQRRELLLGPDIHAGAAGARGVAGASAGCSRGASAATSATTSTLTAAAAAPTLTAATATTSTTTAAAATLTALGAGRTLTALTVTATATAASAAATTATTAATTALWAITTGSAVLTGATTARVALDAEGEEGVEAARGVLRLGLLIVILLLLPAVGDALAEEEREVIVDVLALELLGVTELLEELAGVHGGGCEECTLTGFGLLLLVVLECEELGGSRKGELCLRGASLDSLSVLLHGLGLAGRSGGISALLASLGIGAPVVASGASLGHSTAEAVGRAAVRALVVPLLVLASGVGVLHRPALGWGGWKDRKAREGRGDEGKGGGRRGS